VYPNLDSKATEDGFPTPIPLNYVQGKELAVFCLPWYLDTQACQTLLVAPDGNRNSCDEATCKSDFNSFIELPLSWRRQRVRSQ
jgi:hypothetical protein